MNKLLLILSLSFMLAGEMEVDGDLNVSGNIQSPTIAQLQEIIEQLQAQINSMQNADNKLETRVFEYNISGERDYTEIIDLSELTGYEIEHAKINIIGFNSYQISNCSEAYIYMEHNYIHNNQSEYWTGYEIALYDNGTTNYAYGGFNNIIYDGNNLVRFKIVTCDSGYLDADVKLSVTAQFSDSDVQLRKTGFQSKDKRTIK